MCATWQVITSVPELGLPQTWRLSRSKLTTLPPFCARTRALSTPWLDRRDVLRARRTISLYCYSIIVTYRREGETYGNSMDY